MKLSWENLIQSAATGEIAALERLDARGLFPAPQESAVEFAQRLALLNAATVAFETELTAAGKLEPVSGITLDSSAAVKAADMDGARRLTARLYSFENAWTPGFYINERFGWFWGGCSLSDAASGLNIFIIRKNFMRRERWGIYSRTELGAHEMCHAARAALNDARLEEYFAYQTSTSGLRRYLGSCFVGRFDALIFLGGLLLLLAVQILMFIRGENWPLWPWVLLAAIGPVGLLLRNQLTRNRVRQAKKKLTLFGVKAVDSVLFRCIFPEVREIAALRDAAAWHKYVADKVKPDLRWRIMVRRFNLGEGE